jgi:hypothetical protein
MRLKRSFVNTTARNKLLDLTLTLSSSKPSLFLLF